MCQQRKGERSTRMGETTLDEHSITENRKGGGFTWRQWSGGLTMTERLKESRSEKRPLDRNTDIMVTGDPGHGQVCVHIKGLKKAL